MKIIGAIIAGGKSSRMGGVEKAFMQLSGKGILDLVIGRLEPQVDHLVINANGDPARFLEFELDVVPDVFMGLTTPLAGLHAGLKHAKNCGGDVLITSPSDIPFLPLDLASQLLDKAQAGGAAIARSGGQDHYVIGAWKTGLLDNLETAISRNGIFRVKDWAKHVDAAATEWPVIPHDPFFNVNTPEDLQLAEAIARANS
jgi:molybdenum cofactor guanylyltransferase